jgi:hypothetical protein
MLGFALQPTTLWLNRSNDIVGWDEA